MALFDWNSSFEINHPELDRQHRHLTELINQLDEAAMVPRAPANLQKLLQQLVDYTRYHFSTEEALMDGAPHLNHDVHAHKRAHQTFIKRITDLEERLDQPESLSLLGFLVEWLVNHILKTDRAMVAELGGGPPETDAPAGTDASTQLMTAVQEDEHRFLLLADHVPTMLWMGDPQGARTFFNRAWVEQTGLSRQALLGEQWQALIHPADRQTYLARYREALDDQQPYALELRIRDPRGGYRSLRENVVPRFHQDGTFAGLNGACHDVTELRQAQTDSQALQEQVAQTIRQLTQSSRRIQGLEQRLQQEKDAQQQLLDQLKSAQQQLIQSDKMAAVGHLAAGVAHEINNPIGYVKSNIGTLEDYVQNLLSLLKQYHRMEASLAGDPHYEALQTLRARIDPAYIFEDIQDLVNETKEGLDRVQNIVQDLKDFSRSDSNVWESADLNHCLESTLNVAWNEIKYKAEVIKLYGELPPVRCLPRLLCQVFMNLLVNAAQAIEKRGQITLSTQVEGDSVEIRIQDNGSGIPEELQQQIFEPFFTTKPAGIGTGLGLAISHGIIQRHRGSMTVDSTPGEGTRFTIRLPIQQAD